MFLGNFLIGSLQPAQQIGLIQAKNLKKLQIFCKKERLDKSAETCLIEHSEGLESILEYTLKNYGAFQEENNDLFFKYYRTNKELLLLFLQVVEPNFDYMMEMLQLFKDYPQAGECFKQKFQKLSEGDKTEFINQLKQDEKLFYAFLGLIPIEITEVSLFEAFLNYYQNQIEVLRSYLSMYNLPQDFQKVLQRKQLWSLIEVYIGAHTDFVFSNPVDYCAFCHEKIRIWSLEGDIGTQTDFVSSNSVDYCSFCHEKIQMQRFRVTASAEAGIFEDKDLLLSLASRNCIFNHENKIRFITLYRDFPKEVEQYLAQYGKSIDFSEEEQLKILQCQKNWVEHIKVQSLAVYRDYVLPEKRKKHIPCSEEDLPMLIRLSLDNPLPLEQFIVEHGRVSPQLEVELFFKADEKCREKYIELYGVNFLLHLVQNAAQYGATETEQQLLKPSNFANLPTYFTLLNKLKMFQKKEFKQMQMDICELSDEAREKRGCSNVRCEDCHRVRISQSIELSILLNIARRNYLRGGC